MRISHTHHDAVSAATTIQPLSRATFDAIRQFDTCTIANAIEHFKVRLRNEGYTLPGLQCVTGGSPRLLGYAATCRVRSADPPMSGNAYVDRTDWWEKMGLLPVPRIAVFQDLDAAASGAATIGEVHAAILKAFHCEGVITNGSVRDVPGVSQMQFPMFASAVSVSHSYMHIVDFGARSRSSDFIFDPAICCTRTSMASSLFQSKLPRAFPKWHPESAPRSRRLSTSASRPTSPWKNC